ncbi:PKD domain-containing protein [Myxococcota bacterium]|nr:PKD domain-containing protein [Myxococcota bacterium]
MRRTARTAVVYALVAAAAGAAGAAWAAPVVTITSPTAGDCLSAGGPPVAAQAGAEPPVLPADVRLTVDIGGLEGQPITVTALVDGEPVVEALHVPALDGVEESLELVLPALAVHDGPDRSFRVEALDADGASADAVVATLDRQPPRVSFPAEVLAGAGACAPEQPADPAFQVSDGLDAAPSGAGRWLAVGCERRFEVTVADHCGAAPNRSVVTYRLRRPPPAALGVTFESPTEGEIALRAVVDYTLTAGEGCVESVTASLTRDGGAAAPLFDGDIVVEPGTYAASVTVDPVCSDVTATARRGFTVVGRPVADAGGPYQARQGQVITLDAGRSTSPPAAGAIRSYDWDLDADGFYDLIDAGPTVPFMREVDGRYPVWVRITTAAGERAFDDALVTVSDPEPSCDAGGPYAVEQGAPLTLDGSRTVAGGADEPILSYAWDFGDDRFPQQGDGLIHPVHRFEREGEYVVTLTAFDVDSTCVATARVSVRDVTPVIRNLHVLEDGRPEGEAVEISAGQTSAGSAAEPLQSFTWTFGDGTPPVSGPELRAVSHVYPDDGAYEICLSVRDVDSTVSECLMATVTDLSPRALLTGPGFALEGEPVSFDAAGSRAGGAADPLTGLTFDFGDETPPVRQAPGETAVEHVFTRSGEVTVRVTVADEDSTAEASRRVLVEDATPQAALDAPRGGLEAVPVTFDASASIGGAQSDPIVMFRWDFGDGTSREGPALERVDHAFPDNGLYLVVLTVEDADGSVARRDALVRIENVAPTGTRIELVGAGVAEVGRPVDLAVRTTDVAADPLRVTWSFGDGGRAEGPAEVSHTWGAPGRYRVVATVDDGDGGQGTAELFVTVERPGPTIEGPTSGVATEGVPHQALFDVRPAPVAAGTFDAPVTVRVFGVSPGARVEVLDLGRPDAPLQRVRFDFTPGYADEGRHAIVVEARSASGLVRQHRFALDVQDAGTPVLVGVDGARGAGEVSLFEWSRAPATGVVGFTRRARTPLGEVPGPLVLGPAGRYGFLSLPGAGVIAVLDLSTGAVVRRIPLGADLRPPTFLDSNGVLFVLGPGNRLHRLDEATLKLERPVVLEAPEGLMALIHLGEPEAGVILGLGRSGRTLYRWSGAVLGGVRPSPPMTVELEGLTDGVRDLFPAPDGLSVWAPDRKRPALLRLDAAALSFPRPVLDGVTVTLSGVAQTVAFTPDAIWAVTSAGLERIVTPEAGGSVTNPRRWRGLAAVPAALLGESILALGTTGAIELHRTADAAVVEVWRGNGAARLQVGLRR